MPPEEKKERIPIKSLRTYQGDVDEAISKNKYSSTTILVAEQKRKEEAPQKTSLPIKDNSARNKIFIYLGGMLFVLGIIAISSVYYVRSNEKTVVEQKTKTLISFTKENKIDASSFDREKILNLLKSQKDGFKSPVNSVLFINTEDGGKQADIESLISFIGPGAPSSLLRSFDSQYMIGVYSYDTNEVFLILKVKDFASSYSGMLKWEKDMPKDLQKVFSIDQTLIDGNTPFVDLAEKNKDLRVLRDTSGNTQLMYSFTDKETLVITKNEKIFDAILGRLAISKQAR